MIITHHGGNYFKFQAGQLTLLIDPLDQRSFRGAQAVLNTTLPSHAEEPAETPPAWISHAGEYEVQGIEIQGWSSGNDGKTERTVYRVVMDNIVVGILGHLTGELSEDALEGLSGVDILLVPAGGKPWIAEATAAKIARELEPSLVIPSLTKDPKVFLKAFGRTAPKTEEKLVVKKKDLAPGALNVVCLSS